MNGVIWSILQEFFLKDKKSKRSWKWKIEEKKEENNERQEEKTWEIVRKGILFNHMYILQHIKKMSKLRFFAQMFAVVTMGVFNDFVICTHVHMQSPINGAHKKFYTYYTTNIAYTHLWMQVMHNQK